MVSYMDRITTKTKRVFFFPVHTPFILHGGLVGAGSLCPGKEGQP